jgi:hypothetical protein
MKRFYFMISMLLIVSFSIGQTTIFEEGFNDPTYDFEHPDYDTSFPPAGWIIIDSDDDGQNWYGIYSTTATNGYLSSRSYDQGTALTPDNWIVTPAIDLTSIPSGDDIYLGYVVRPSANTPQYKTEHYGIFVSTAGTTPFEFTEVFSETLTDTMSNITWYEREIDLSAYQGETIYIAFRHWQSTDKDRIHVDEIIVWTETSNSIQNSFYEQVRVFPNPVSDILTIEGVSDATADIFTVTGMNVFSQIVSTHSSFVNISELPEGIYILRITSGENVSNRKLIIAR